MKKFAFAAIAPIALAACGSSDSANEAASPENVEMPAEEAMNTTDASPAPVADTASTPAADAGAAAPTPTSSAAVEDATKAAEGKM